MPPDSVAPEGWGEYRLLVVETLRDLKAAIAEANTKLDELRRDTVPISDYQDLVHKVESLWSRDLEIQRERKELVGQVRTMWEERTKRQGAAWVWRIFAATLGLIVALLTAINLLRSLGLHL